MKNIGRSALAGAIWLGGLAIIAFGGTILGNGNFQRVAFLLCLAGFLLAGLVFATLTAFSKPLRGYGYLAVGIGVIAGSGFALIQAQAGKFLLAPTIILPVLVAYCGTIYLLSRRLSAARAGGVTR